MPISLSGSLNLSGSLTTTGTITATTLVVQTITSSISSITGSTNFGSLVTDTHKFTGSLNVTGSLSVVTTGTEFQVTSTGVRIGNALTDSHTVTGSMNVSGSLTANSGIFKNAGVPAIQGFRDLDVTIVGTAGQGIELGARNGASTYVAGASIYGILDNPPTTGYMVFQTLTSSALSTKMVILSNGNVGIGTASPSYTLDISGTGRFTSNVVTSTYFNANNSTRDIYLNSSADFGFGSAPAIQVASNHNLQFATNNSLRMVITSGSLVGIGTHIPMAQLSMNNQKDGGATPVSSYAATNGVQGQNFFNGYYTYNSDGVGPYPRYFDIVSVGSPDGSNGGSNIRFFTNPVAVSSPAVERMRITSGGTVLINAAAVLDASARFQTNGNVYLGNQPAGAGTGGLKYHTSTGLVTYDASARIYKKDIIDIQYGLDSVLKMQPKKYKWKSNDDTDLGFIADEMYQVIPEIVFLANNEVNQTELEDGEPMGINYDRLIPVLVKAIQELQAQITELKNK